MAKVLIVDDSLTMRAILKGMLADLGHEIIAEAVDGQDGYEKYMELRPDFVTMDMTMPILDGIECIQKIRKEDETAKIILVTSNAQPQKVSEGVEAGAGACIFKPIVKEEMKHAIHQIGV